MLWQPLLILFVMSAGHLSVKYPVDGRWEGTIVASKAESEIDVLIEFNHPSTGALSGQVWFPTHPNGPYVMHDLSIQHEQVYFFVRDEAGIVSTFRGRINSDGSSITGTFTENSESLPFTITQVPAPSKPNPLTISLKSADQLKSSFDKDSTSIRFILILSPGAFSSKMTLKLFERYVLRSISNANLRTYVIWEAPVTPRTQAVIRQASMLVSDPRVSYFWTSTRDFTKIFSRRAGQSGEQAIPNLCLLFSAGTKWTEPSPAPEHAWTTPPNAQLASFSTDSKFNGLEVFQKASSLLATP